MSLTWVVVADRGHARIFSSSGPRAGLQELDALTHPAARLHDRDLVSDAPGRSFDSGGQGRHAMSSQTEPRQHEAEVFARRVGEHLDSARQRRLFEKLILVASPEFLGLLRKLMTQPTADRVVATVNKNLVQHDTEEIRDHLPHWF